MATKLPSLGEQRELIRPLLNQKLVKGDTWYLVDARWMRQWKKYTGYDQLDQSAYGICDYYPGPLETKSLFAGSGDELKEHLMEELDYNVVPEKAWDHLLQWYGLAEGSKPIARKVEYGLGLKYCKLEVYLLNFKLSLYPKLDEIKIRKFSRVDTVADLKSKMRRIYSIPDEIRCRMWYQNMSHPYELLPYSLQTLQDVGLYNMQSIVIEIQNSDGTWPKKVRYSSSTVLTSATVAAPKEENVSANKDAQKSKPLKKKVYQSKEKVIPRQSQSRKTEENQSEKKVPSAGDVPSDEEDWLSMQQKSQVEELSQSVLSEHQRANQATQRAQNALNRLARAESQIKSLNQSLDYHRKQLNKVKQSLQTAEKSRDAEHERANRAEESVGLLEQQLRDTERRLQRQIRANEQQLQWLRNTERRLQQQIRANEQHVQRLRNTERRLQQQARANEQQLKQLKDTEQHLQQQIQTNEQQLQQLRDKEQCLQQQIQTNEQQLQQLRDTEQRLQQQIQTNEQQAQQLQQATETAALAERRLQHSDQMFQDIFQRLIGQLPQSHPPWVVQRDEIEFTEEEIGAGGWATVKIAKFRGNQVAAKCLHRQIVSAHNVRIFTREMNMASNARHQNLLQFIGATLDNQEPIILTELMPTSLSKIMEEGTRLSQPQIVSVARQVALALNYLHLTQPEAIIHRDVSSSNVLLDPAIQSGWKAKLSDYGSANFVRHTTTAGPGNPTYAAPESANPQHQTTKMDVFSFAVLLVEMCTGELAPSEDRDRLLGSIRWAGMVALIQRGLTREPQRRPDMATLITQLDQLLE